MSSDLVCHMAILGILLISDSRTRWTFGTFDFQVSSMPPSSQTRSLPGFVEPPGSLVVCSLVVCSMRMVLGISRTVLDIWWISDFRRMCHKRDLKIGQKRPTNDSRRTCRTYHKSMATVWKKLQPSSSRSHVCHSWRVWSCTTFQ